MNDRCFRRAVDMPGEATAQTGGAGKVTMLPEPWAIMMGAACFIPNITPRTFVLKTEEKFSAVSSVIVTIGEPLPALLTRQSSLPNRLTA